MSTELEQLSAQSMAFNHKPTQHWHRHLIGPMELQILMEKARKHDAAMHRLNRIMEKYDEPAN